MHPTEDDQNRSTRASDCACGGIARRGEQCVELLGNATWREYGGLCRLIHQPLLSPAHQQVRARGATSGVRQGCRLELGSCTFLLEHMRIGFL